MPTSPSLALKITGRGKPLVMLPGWGMSSAQLTPLCQRLELDYQLLLIDLPGCGFNADIEHSYHLPTLTATLGRTLATHLKQPAMVLGWSLGGLVANALGARFPERVSRVINIASSPRFTEQAQWPGMAKRDLMHFSTRLTQAPQQTLQRFFQLQCHGLNQTRHAFRSMLKQWQQQPQPRLSALVDGLDLLIHTDQRSALASTKIPTLLLYGEHDSIVPIDTLAAIGRYGNRHISQKIVPNAAHMPFLTHTTETYQPIITWLTQ